jgi:hypothetical protein
MNLGYNKDLYVQPFDHRGTVFWEPLVGLRAKKTSRETAVAEIARRYAEFVHVFEAARAS